jgi:hypothetical protein
LLVKVLRQLHAQRLHTFPFIISEPKAINIIAFLHAYAHSSPTRIHSALKTSSSSAN